MPPISNNLMREFLINHEMDKIEVNALDDHNLRIIYEEKLKEIALIYKKNLAKYNFVLNTSPSIPNEPILQDDVSCDEFTASKLKGLLDSALEVNDDERLYQVLGLFLQNLNYQTICKDIDLYYFPKKQTHRKLQAMLNIKFRELQEILLADLNEKLSGLDVKERANLLAHFEEKRDDINYLKNYMHNLNDSSLEALKNISDAKATIVKEYLDSEELTIYNAYNKTNKERLKLIEKIKKEVASIDIDFLRDQDIMALNKIYSEILREKENSKEKLKTYKKFAKELEIAAKLGDERSFISVCYKSIQEIGKDSTREIIKVLAEKTPILLTQYDNQFNLNGRTFDEI